MREHAPHVSIEWKLPIVMSALVVAVLVSISWVTYREVARSARETAAARVVSASHSLAASNHQLVASLLTIARPIARDPRIESFLEKPSKAKEAGALAALQRMTSARHFAAVELRDTAGMQVLALGAHIKDLAVIPRSFVAEVKSDAGFSGRLRALGDTAAVPSVVPITRAGHPLGYFVTWTWVTTTPSEHIAIVRVMGPEALDVLVGQDSVWTDGLRLIQPRGPLVNSSGELRYTRDGSSRLTALTHVQDATWQVGVEYSEALALAPARHVVRLIAIPGLAIVVIALIGVWLTSRRITHPLRRLIDASETMSQGDFTARVDLPQRDELGQLGAAFNNMAEHVQDSHRQLNDKMEELRRTQEQVVQAQRMEAVGRLAGGVAHDFNNLLSVIIGETDLALMTGTVNPQLKESFGAIRKAGEHAASLTKQLLAFSRRQLVQPTVFELNDLLMDTSKMLHRLIGEDVELVTRTTSGDSSVLADRSQIEQVILNLVVNARDAMPNGGKLILETSSIVLDDDFTRTRPEVTPGAYVLLKVSDTGKGMTDEVKARVFEPFFTTKEVGKGTGLGLATCFGIVKQSGGYIAAYSEAEVGTSFNVYLPHAKPVAASHVESVQAPLPRGRESILVTEDDEPVRKVAVRILTAQGYSVLQAPNAGEALRILTSSEVRVDLLLTDVVLPHMGGRELAEGAQKLRPGLKVLFASGYTDDVILQHRLIAHDVVLVQKPFTAESLGRKVREVLDAPARALESN